MSTPNAKSLFPIGSSNAPSGLMVSDVTPQTSERIRSFHKTPLPEATDVLKTLTRSGNVNKPLSKKKLFLDGDLSEDSFFCEQIGESEGEKKDKEIEGKKKKPKSNDQFYEHLFRGLDIKEREELMQLDQQTETGNDVQDQIHGLKEEVSRLKSLLDEHEAWWETSQTETLFTSETLFFALVGLLGAVVFVFLGQYYFNLFDLLSFGFDWDEYL